MTFSLYLSTDVKGLPLKSRTWNQDCIGDWAKNTTNHCLLFTLGMKNSGLDKLDQKFLRFMMFNSLVFSVYCIEAIKQKLKFILNKFRKSANTNYV